MSNLREALAAESRPRKQKLEALCRLGRSSREVPLAELMGKLKLKSEDAVEDLLVYAISQKYVDAKIDYGSNVVRFSRALLVDITPETWREAQERLHLWRDNVRATLNQLMSAPQTLAGPDGTADAN